MQVRITGDTVEIDGYVNAIERNSKPLESRMGPFVERVSKGAFAKALKRNDDVRILLNHDWNRDLGGTKDGNLELTEDAIGLKARATITDPDVVQKARNGDLVGWSFGFFDREVENTTEHDMPTRIVRDMDLYEVSLLDRTRTPAYDGTLVTTRAKDGSTMYHGAMLDLAIDTREYAMAALDSFEDPEPIDYSQYEEMIQELKGE